MTTISVVLPFLDAAQFLAEAIASVQAQTMTDWELLLVDDGSTDMSPLIARTAADRDERITVLSRPAGSAGGAAAARNFGLAHTTGNYITFLDADDLFDPHQLAEHVAAFERHPEIGLAYGPTRWWHPAAPRHDWVESMRPFAGRVHAAPSLLTRVFLEQRGHVPCTCSVALRRSVVAEVGGFEEAFCLYEDQTLWVKALAGHAAYVSGVVGATYRQHENSTSARAARAGTYERTGPHQSRAAFLEWVADYTQARGPADERVERALRIAFLRNGMAAAQVRLRDRLTVVAYRVADAARSRSRRLASAVRHRSGA